MTPRTRLELQLGMLLRRAHRRSATALTPSIQPLGIEGRHFGVMMVLRRSSGLSQTELIAAVESDKSTMVRTIDDLSSLGFVTRTPSSTDRRVQLVSLTDAGRDAADDAVARATPVASELFADFTDDEVETLVRLLTRFLG